MTKCQICQKEVDLPFNCSYCGGSFCEKHRLPENHSCTGLPERTFFADKIQKAYGREASYPEEQHPEVSPSKKRQYSPILVILLVLSMGLNGILFLNYNQSKQEIESLNEKYSLLDDSHKTLTQEFANFRTDSRHKITEAHDTGYREGNTSGYSLGLTVGEERGYDLGYEIGYGKGSQEGYQEGYLKGYSQGNETGTEIGYQTGFEEGLETGARGDYEGWGYFVKDPTYAEALKFISEDKTNKMEYIKDEFVCHEFSYMFKNNAYQKGYRCFFVHVALAESDHMIVGFNTTDRRIVFIEPQNDCLVDLRVGDHYWNECVLSPLNYAPTYDDTVVHFKIFW